MTVAGCVARAAICVGRTNPSNVGAGGNEFPQTLGTDPQPDMMKTARKTRMRFRVYLQGLFGHDGKHKPPNYFNIGIFKP